MTIDATFWVAVSFFIFVMLLVYYRVPQKVNSLLSESINSIINQINSAESLK
jgi:F-type H+-transporting ATPase subunit b